MQLTDRLTAVRARIAVARAKVDATVQSEEANKKLARTLSGEEALLTEELALAKLCVSMEADSATYIESIATALLQSFFQSDIEFNLRKVFEGDALIGLSPCYVKAGKDVPIKAVGGGCRNLTTLGIRMALLALASIRHGLELTMIMDEQLLNLDPDNWNKLVEFQNKIADLLNMQFIYILHTPVEFPVMVKFTPSGGSTKVTTRISDKVVSNNEFSNPTAKEEA
jgi:DNA repair exonuclease SbcCD ATPase subunit